jgi:hypothetical protein
MAAADQVKPVEFKVGFWQVALYGEIAFIGFWFILILTLAAHNARWKTEEPNRNLIAPTVRFEETNRYSVVAQTIVDLLNTNDYAAVQKLFNPDMSKALPQEKASVFFAGLATSFGNIEKVEGPTGNGYRGWTGFRLDCQRGELLMSLALDDDDKIAGLYFQPAFAPFPTLQISRIFNWQHLLWIVPFFLGGLICSRIIQKTTRRAVGISSG